MEKWKGKFVINKVINIIVEDYITTISALYYGASIARIQNGDAHEAIQMVGIAHIGIFVGE